MKILVIDDNQLHLDAAVAQLGKNHEVICAQTFKYGQELLGFTYEHGKTTHKHDFDVVLCDLLMPAPDQMSSRSGMGGQEMPIGMFLALIAAKNGAKYVGLLTDTNHHAHPASECLDGVRSWDNWGPARYDINGAKVVFCNNDFVSVYSPTDLATPLEYTEYSKISGWENAKNWSAFLKYLLNQTE